MVEFEFVPTGNGAGHYHVIFNGCYIETCDVSERTAVEHRLLGLD